MDDRISQDDFLSGIRKQQAIIRKLFASKRRRNEMMTDLARKRYGWMIGKFFDTGEEAWYHVPLHTICCVRDIKAITANVFDDTVKLWLDCKVIVPRIENNAMVNLSCHTETFSFDHTEDLEATLAGKWVDWQVADEWFHNMYEKMRQSYGLKYDRLTIALDNIDSLKAALEAKEETHRMEMRGMVKWTDDFEKHLHSRLCEDYEQANNMVAWASRCDKPMDGEGLIRVSESADSIIKFIKKELGLIKED